MDLNEILIFIKVVEHGSFIAASKAIDIPKSTVSRKVSELEQRLGVRLIQRTTRAFNLTEPGQELYQRCRHLIADLEDAEAIVKSKQATPSGRLKISIVYEFASAYLISAVSSFLQKYPEITLEVELTNREIDVISEGYDLAIVPGLPKDLSLVTRKLGPGEATYCASPKYLEKHGIPLKPTDLKDHDWICYSSRT